MVHRLTRIVASLSLLIPLHGWGLGLGDLDTGSALNQRLDATIELISVRPGELEDLKVNLADRNTFERAGLERSFLLTKLKFTVVESQGKAPYIHVTSPLPIREPFLDFLIELSWPGGHLIREYTILLDPPTFINGLPPAPVQGIAAAPVKKIEPAPETTTPSSAPAAVQEVPARTKPATSVADDQIGTGGEYGPVKSGETLWKIADSVRASSVSVEQMMIALLRSNPEAFINNNINQLKRGKVLRVPDAQESSAITRQQALAEVRRQTIAWKNLRQQIAESKLPASPTVSSPAMPDEEQVVETVDTAPRTEPVLKLVAPDGEAGVDAEMPSAENVAALQNELALAGEAVETAEKENEELRGRVQSLEAQLEKMRRLLELQDADLESLQDQQAPLEEAVEAGAEAVDGMVPEDVQEEMADTMADAEEVVEEMVQPEEVAEEPVPAPVASTAPEQPIEKPKSKDAFDPAKMLEEYGAIIAGAIILLLVVIIVAIAKRRRNKDDFPESILQESQAPASKTVASTTPTSQETSFLDDFDVSEMGSIQTDIGEADPVAEADVFLAYGRYQQAEDLITEAIEENPDRPEYKLKLMEIQKSGDNRDGFLATAEMLFASLGGQSSAVWDKACVLGREFCPESPLWNQELAQASEADSPAASGALSASDALLPEQLSEDDLNRLAGIAPAAGEEPVEESVEEEAIEEPTPEPEAAEKDSEEMDLDLGFDLDAASEEATEQAASEPEPELDLSGLEETEEPELDGLDIDIDLDLDEDTGQEPEVEIEEEQPAVSEPPSFDEDLMSGVDEVGTKLDLARAYIDMGDAEGARSILQEVMDEGDDAQKNQARELMSQVGE